MAEISAGILLYRGSGKGLEIFLVHPGGPFWAKKDAGAWSIPKGLAEPGEDLLSAANREFHEETGLHAEGEAIPLQPVKLKSGKIIHAFAMRGDVEPEKIRSNSFELEWPPHSGKKQQFPEVDRAGWFTIAEAKEKINNAQTGLLSELERIL